MTAQELADQQIRFKVRTFIYVLVAVFAMGGSAAGLAVKLSSIDKRLSRIEYRLGINDYRSGERDVAQHEARDLADERR